MERREDEVMELGVEHRTKLTQLLEGIPHRLARLTLGSLGFIEEAPDAARVETFGTAAERVREVSDAIRKVLHRRLQLMQLTHLLVQLTARRRRVEDCHQKVGTLNKNKS